MLTLRLHLGLEHGNLFVVRLLQNFHLLSVLNVHLTQVLLMLV